MRRAPLFALALALAVACGEQTDSTATDTTTGIAGETSTSTSTTSATTAEPTTTDATTTGTTGTDTTGPEPSCETSAMACGVDVGEQMSFCPQPEDPAGALEIEVLGPGQIRISELGHDAECDLTFTPNVQLLPNHSLLVSYDIGGQPTAGCVCKYTISWVLSDLTSGTWTVQVASFMQQVDVP